MGSIVGRPFRAACLALCVAGGARAQEPVRAAAAPGTILGTVVDASSGAPVAAATVRLLELGRNELSHQDGSFHFEGVSPGSYRVVAQRLGFAPQERSVSVGPGGSARLDIVLSPSVIAIPGLVVTGTGRARSAGEAYRPTTVLDDARLRRHLGSSVAATLAEEPGIAQRYNGPAASQPVIRGLGGDRVLVLEDGLRTGDISSTSADHAVTVEPLTAERIEVLRGPAGLLYGSNALGGVVNVVREEVPRTVPERPTGALTVQGESVNRGYAAGGSVTGGAGPFAVRAELSGRSASDTRTPEGVLPSTRFGGYNGGLGGAWVRDRGFVGVAVRDYGLEYGVPGSFNGTLIPGGHEDGVSIDLRRTTVRAEAGLFSGIGPLSSISWDAHYVRFQQEEREDDGGIGTAFGQLTGTTSLRAHHRHEAGGLRSEGTIGASALWQDHRVRGSAGSAPAELLGGALFAYEELAVDPFRLQVGGRFDWTSIRPLEESSPVLGALRERRFAALSGSVAGLYEPVTGLVLGASVSRAFRNPSIPELYSGGPHLADFSFNVGNPELEAEYGLGTDLFARLRTARVSGEVAAYRNRIDNYIYYAPTGRLDPRLQRFPLYQARGDDALLRGVEGSLEGELVPRLVAAVGGSYVHAARLGDDRPLPAIPPLQGRAALRYETPDIFGSVELAGAARQDRVDEFEQPTPGYALWNVGLGYRRTVGAQLHSLTLQVENLGDRLWRDHLSRIRAVAPQPGRNVQLLYRVSF